MKSLKSLAKAAVKAVLVLLVLACASAPAIALAHTDLRLEGDWADAEKPVTLDAVGTPRSHAIELLADAAGWSVVWSSPLVDPVELHVKDQPASKVLELLLPDGSYVARRTGSLVSIQSVAPPVAAGAPVASTIQHGRGEDRTVLGGKLTVQKGEVVHDVAVFGGHLDVYGTVTGDLAVLGGSAHVHDGAKVQGSATILGGKMRVDDGAVVDHDVGVVGGHLDRGAHAKIGNAVEDRSEEEARALLDVDEPEVGAHGRRAIWSRLRDWGDDALGSLSAAALLFVFGTVVIALGTERSNRLRVEVAARPMRTFALGVVGTVVAVGVFVALCVTIIGIPVALVFGLAFVLAAYVGVSAVLTTAGEALLRHRTKSSYVHLALGCALYFLVGLVPGVGRWGLVVVGLLGLGALVATRAAGLVPERSRRGGLPPADRDVAY